jgi:hypothetical protein
VEIRIPVPAVDYAAWRELKNEWAPSYKSIFAKIHLPTKTHRTSQQTMKKHFDLENIPDMTGKVCIVTGSNTGVHHF